MLEEKARILVADDARQNAELIRAILTLAGYEVLVAYDGEQALAVLRAEAGRQFDPALVARFVELVEHGRLPDVPT